MEHQVLYNTHGLLLLITGSVVAFLYWTVQTDRRDRSALWIAATTFSGGISLLLLSGPHGKITGFLACCLFLATPALLHIAVGSAGRESLRTTLPTVIAVAVTGLVLNVVTGNMKVALITVPASLVATMWLVLRNPDSVTRAAKLVMAAFLGVHLVTFCLRIKIILGHQPHHGYLAYGGMLTIVGLGVSFIAMEALRSRHEFERMAMTDPLTGLLNRRALDLVALREVQRCIHLNQPCSALMMDIDRFKEINDTMGHAAGDASLRAIAGILQSMLRPSDVITRHGGDEFFILLPECSEHETGLIVARLRRAIAACTLHTAAGHPFQLDVSMGVATLRGPNITVQDLLHDSDLGLYRAKGTARLERMHQPAADFSDNGGAQVHPSNA